MVKRAIIAFFKPSLLIIILTAAMLVVSTPAQLPERDEPKPDQFRMIYAYLMIPFAFVAAAGWILSLYGLYDVPGDMTTPFGALLHIIYFYILSCFVGLIYRNVRDNETWQKRVQKTKPA